MEPTLVGILGTLVLLFLLAYGVHIALALGVVGLVGLALIMGFDPAAWLSTSLFFNKIASFELVTVPLFVLMGLVAGAVGVSHNLYNTASMWLNRVRGGLGIATVVSCAAFGMVTGSSLVCATVFTKISAPEMRRHGYDKGLAYGLCASAGALGMLIPPSVLMVVYGILSDVSIGKLLIAGISPGLIMALFFCATVMILGYIKPSSVGFRPTAEGVAWRRRITSLRLIWPVFVVGLVIIGGIFTGVFSPTEAAAVGTIVVIIVASISTGRKAVKVVIDGVRETIPIAAMVFFILSGASLYARLLVLSGITPRILDFTIGLGLSQYGLIIFMTVLYLILGCFLDSISILTITLPTIIPVVNALGIEPIWFAMVAITSIELGVITPPVGLNVFAAYAVAERDVKLEDIFRGILPFFWAMMATVIVIIIFPWLSTILPSLAYGG